MVTDGQPDTFSRWPASQESPAECSQLLLIRPEVEPLSNGDITMVDAQVLDHERSSARSAAGVQFGFENQGRCIALAILTTDPQICSNATAIV